MIVSAAKATEAAGVLGVELESLTPDLLARAYRTKAKECHPDVKPNPELWARVSWANEALKRWLERQPAPVKDDAEGPKGTCRACGGQGRIPVRRTGFGKPMTMQCVMCNGSGIMPTGGTTPHYGGSSS